MFEPKLVFWVHVTLNGGRRSTALQVEEPDEQGLVLLLTSRGKYVRMSKHLVSRGRRVVHGQRRVLFEKLLAIHGNVETERRRIDAASALLRRRRLA